MRSILHVMVASPAARIPSWQAERQPQFTEKFSQNVCRVDGEWLIWPIWPIWPIWRRLVITGGASAELESRFLDV
jgi:hypothetical protein